MALTPASLGFGSRTGTAGVVTLGFGTGAPPPPPTFTATVISLGFGARTGAGGVATLGYGVGAEALPVTVGGEPTGFATPRRQAAALAPLRIDSHGALGLRGAGVVTLCPAFALVVSAAGRLPGLSGGARLTRSNDLRTLIGNEIRAALLLLI